MYNRCCIPMRVQKQRTPDSWSIEIIISDQFQSTHIDAEKWEVEFDCTYIHNPLKSGRSINRNII